MQKNITPSQHQVKKIRLILLTILPRYWCYVLHLALHYQIFDKLVVTKVGLYSMLPFCLVHCTSRDILYISRLTTLLKKMSDEQIFSFFPTKCGGQIPNLWNTGRLALFGKTMKKCTSVQGNMFWLTEFVHSFTHGS